MWQKFIEILEKKRGRNYLNKFLNNFFSEHEKKAVIKRLAAIALIRQGKTYKEIGEILWLAPNTISSIRKSLRNSQCYKSYRWFRQEKEKKALKNLKPTKGVSWFESFCDAFPNIILPPPKTGRGRWKSLYYQGK